MVSVSIIIPTFNRSIRLKRAIESVYNQTYRDYELLIIDDGSSDETSKMVADFFPKSRYFYQPNSGVSSARNTGISHAKGTWIAFLDSDDEWLPLKLEKQLELLSNNPDHKICHTNEQWIRNNTEVNQMEKHKKSGGWIFPQCLPLCAMSPSSIVMHRSIFNDVGGFDTSLPACEDYDMWLRITAKYPVLFIEEPQIIKHGGHDDQLSKKYWGMDRFRIKALQNILLQKKLSDEYQQKATKMLLKKCKIFQQGALKRGKIEDAQHYQQIITAFQTNEQ
jgi:GT2 family glycosyltransferase